MKPIILTQIVKEQGEPTEKLFLINPENIGTVLEDKSFWHEGEIPIIGMNHSDRTAFLMTTRNGQKLIVKESLSEIQEICNCNHEMAAGRLALDVAKPEERDATPTS